MKKRIERERERETEAWQKERWGEVRTAGEGEVRMAAAEVRENYWKMG